MLSKQFKSFKFYIRKNILINYCIITFNLLYEG